MPCVRWFHPQRIWLTRVEETAIIEVLWKDSPMRATVSQPR